MPRFLPVNACGMGTVFCERAAAISMLRRTVFSLSVVISRSTYLFRIKWNIISFQFFQSGCLPFTQKLRNFGWNVTGKINVVSTKGNFLAKRGFLETVDQNFPSRISEFFCIQNFFQVTVSPFRDQVRQSQIMHTVALNSN